MSTQLRQLLSHRHGRRATVLSQGSNVSPKLVIRALKGSLMIQSQQSVPCSALFSCCWQHRRDSNLENMTQYFYLCLTYFLIDFFFPSERMQAFCKDHLIKSFSRRKHRCPAFVQVNAFRRAAWKDATKGFDCWRLQSFSAILLCASTEAQG